MDQVRFGLALRALRRRRAWTQQHLADRATLSRSAVQRIERGGLDDFTGRTVRKIAVALGARYDQRILWQGEALDRLLDEDHAAIVEQVIRWLRAGGWDVLPEATFVLAGQRGSVDVLAYHPATGSLLIVEVKSVVPDMQAMLSGIDRKVRAAPSSPGSADGESPRSHGCSCCRTTAPHDGASRCIGRRSTPRCRREPATSAAGPASRPGPSPGSCSSPARQPRSPPRRGRPRLASAQRPHDRQDGLRRSRQRERSCQLVPPIGAPGSFCGARPVRLSICSTPRR